ncbi:MAG: chorismate-binding protein [Flavobacteriales bacterium]|nr:chorismate-binding protein [Flavobacteriales bacterium]
MKENQLLQQLLEATKTCNVSVAGFSLPGESKFTFWIQSTDLDYPPLNDSEFIIYPFFVGGNFPIIRIKPQWSIYDNEVLPEPIQKKLINSSTKSTEYWHSLIDNVFEATNIKDFLLQVDEIKHQISLGNIEKAMLSAIRVLPRSEKKIADILLDLRKNYPNAFISYTSTPIHGTWIGATPEILLFQHDKRIETVSLAGTKTLEQQHEWSEKERHEQDLVTQYIHEIFHKYPIEEIEIQGPEYYSIGPLIHLRTLFRINLQDIPQKPMMEKLAREMHPTPAVGGYPKTASLKLIQQLEKHERSYYAGFLGPITLNSSSLFVNLRCASLHRNQVAFYSGAGITAGSDPESEWEETGHKAASIAKYF